MIFVGIYYSVIVISEDSKLRSTIKRAAEREQTLLTDISYSQLETAIEKRTMKIVEGYAQLPTSKLSVKHPDNEEIRNYANSVIEELLSYDPAYFRIIEKEEILNKSQIFIACINGNLLKFIIDDHQSLFSDIMDKYKTGFHKGIKIITCIDDSLVDIVEKLLVMNVEIKHISNLDNKEFIVSEKFVLEIPHSDKHVQIEFEVQEEEDLVKYYNRLFANLWASSTNAIDRIKELK